MRKKYNDFFITRRTLFIIFPKKRVCLYDPPNKLNHIHEDMIKVVVGVNVHMHTFMCNKKSQNTCIDAFRQHIIQNASNLTQIIDSGNE